MNNAFTYILYLCCCFLLTSCGASNNVNKQTTFYTVSGSVSGLKSDEFFVISNNTYNGIEINRNGNFTFTKAVAQNNDYDVQIVTQPTGQICTISNGFGINIDTNIVTVQITCSENNYYVSVTVEGLDANQKLTLTNNATNYLLINGNGSYTFPVPIAMDSQYNVVVLTQPNNEICTVNNGSGAGVIANVNNITVLCSNDSYSIGGSVAGLENGQQVTIVNNGDIKKAITLTTNTTFTFTPQTVFGGSYNVTVITQPKNETCSVNNSGGSGVVANINNITILCSNDSYSIGGSVVGLESGQQVTIKNNGDTAHAITLATNTTFTFTPQVIFGLDYNVTISTQPNDSKCSVANGAGIVSGKVSSVLISCSKIPGALIPLGSISTGVEPHGVMVTPNGKYLYVANSNANTISMYHILNNGSLIVLPTPTILSNNYPSSIAITPDGNYAYVTNNSGNTISMYSIASNGELSALTVPTISSGNSPSSIAITPNGRYIYVTNSGDSTISMYSITDNGELSTLPMPTTHSRKYPASIAITPNGNYAYVTNSQDSIVSMYSINSHGELDALPIPTIPSGDSPSGIAITPNGNYAYATNINDSTLSMYSIATDGNLSYLATPAPTNFAPQSILITPNGNYAYVTNYGKNAVSMYNIGNTGELTPLYVSFNNYTVDTQSSPYGISITPNGQYLYVTNSVSNTVSEYLIQN